MTYLNLLKNIWTLIYDPETDAAQIIEKFFHPNYEQCINGVIMTRSEYIPHVLAQKQTMKIDSIEYAQGMENENELFAIYYPRGTNSKNLPMEAEVIAYFHFVNQQLFRIHGQVRLIQGDLIDADMKNS
jgi:hypothetical protein